MARILLLYQLSYSSFQLDVIRGTGLEPALRESQPLVPSRLHHPLLLHHDALKNRPPERARRPQNGAAGDCPQNDAAKNRNFRRCVVAAPCCVCAACAVLRPPRLCAVVRLQQLVPPERLELPTPWFVARCSAPLSYGGDVVCICVFVELWLGLGLALVDSALLARSAKSAANRHSAEQGEIRGDPQTPRRSALPPINVCTPH